MCKGKIIVEAVGAGDKYSGLDGGLWVADEYGNIVFSAQLDLSRVPLAFVPYSYWAKILFDFDNYTSKFARQRPYQQDIGTHILLGRFQEEVVHIYKTLYNRFRHGKI